MRPLPVVVVNCMSVSTGPRHAKRILLNAAQHGDLILGSECGDFVAVEVLGDDWHVWQDLTTPASAGSMIALRKECGRLHSMRATIGVRRQRGDSIRDRYLLTAEAHLFGRQRPLEVAAGHAPPKRDWDRWAPFMRSARSTHADILGADWNKLGRAVRRALGYKVRTVHILGLAVRWGIPASKPTALDLGGDHKGVLVTLWPERRRK